MAGLGPEDGKGSAADLLGSVLSPEVDKSEDRVKEEQTVEAKDDNEYALRLQLLEYEELERSLPEDLRPDENDLEARLALLRDIAQQQYYMQQQDGVQALFEGFDGPDEMHSRGMRDDMSGDMDEEDEEDEEEVHMAEIEIGRVMELLRSAIGEGGAPSLQAIGMIQEQLRGSGLTLVPQVDVDNMSYEELTDLCDTIGKVNVGLTPEQIRERTIPVTYTPDLDVIDSKCAVCMCEFEIDDKLRQLTCPHVFHTDCIDQWLSESKKCPVCSVEVLQLSTNPIGKKVPPSTPEPKPKKQKQTVPLKKSRSSASKDEAPEEKSKPDKKPKGKKSKPSAKRGGGALLLR
eukprot:TRINITY_DN21073_c0_g1_i1.p1 TRINITY_DN21073_c0_g1~~TRINITY_DN21073_c0_g1_i1.p1  ORF type:complete len:374 (+),score=95.15 TRINITY_DN21073_c0_g1_i1:85-1122(+)